MKAFIIIIIVLYIIILSSTISRVMYQTIIYLVLLLPAGSSDLPKAWRAAFISLLFGLASNGVYMCHCCYQQCGSLLHCLSTLTIAFAMAVYFCCTGLGVTSTGRYPASCPMKPGLSSPAVLRHLQPRLSVLLNIFLIILYYDLSVKNILLLF